MHARPLPHGRVLHWQEQGSGPTVVQVGGVVLGRRNFEHLRPTLSRTCHVIDVELSLDQLADPGRTRAMVDIWADDVVAFVTSLDREPVSLHGISLGGCIVLLAAARRPDLVDSIVVGGTHLRPNAATRLSRQLWQQVAAGAGMGAVADLVALGGLSPERFESEAGQAELAWLRRQFERLPSDDFLRLHGDAGTFDLWAVLPSVPHRALLMAGRHDPMDPVFMEPYGTGLGDAHGVLARSTLLLFDDCAHCYFVERADDTARAVAAFVARRPLGPLANATVVGPSDGTPSGTSGGTAGGPGTPGTSGGTAGGPAGGPAGR